MNTNIFMPRMQYIDMIVKASDIQPSKDIINTIIIPLELDNITKHNIISVVTSKEMELANIIGGQYPIKVFTVHISNLICCN